MLSVYRLSVVFLALLLTGGPPYVCVGWLASAEARMACCAAEGTTHGCRHHHDTSEPLTQADADRCCAASDGDESSPAPVNAASVFAPAAALNPLPAALAAPALRPDLSRAPVPIPASQVPKHLLLSVFLV